MQARGNGREGVCVVQRWESEREVPGSRVTEAQDLTLKWFVDVEARRSKKCELDS